MNYELSKKILQKIKRAENILVNCHRNPDPDSIGSALSFYHVLTLMGKQVDVICPTPISYKNLSVLEGFEKIKTNIDFSRFDFSNYDIFLILDSSNWEMVAGKKDFFPNISTIVIDHHVTNEKFADLNLIDEKITSTGEMVYLILEDWNIEITPTLANCILAAILGDTGIFRFPGTTSRTLRIAAYLIDKGADKDDLVYRIYQSEPQKTFKFYAEVLKRAKLDGRGRFFWAAIPFSVYKSFMNSSLRESAANLFFQSVDKTEFGFIIVEERKNHVSVSFRSRSGFNVAKIAKSLGGGGHVYAAGATISNISFQKAVDKILFQARKLGPLNRVSKK